jgi:hypothetical protein
MQWQRPAELFFAWRSDNDNPLLPVMSGVAKTLAVQAPSIQSMDRSIQ